MIQSESKLFISDNSGGKLAACINIISHSGCKFAYIGDIIKVTIKKCSPRGKIKKGDIYYALIIRTRSGIRRLDGSFIKFNDNSVVILNDKFEPLGTRIFGPIVKELNRIKFSKIFSMASEIL